MTHYVIHHICHVVCNKSPTRKVFTFAGIQSSKSVTYDRETDKVYNNIYPDKPRTSGMVIPKSLAEEQDRPPKQLKTKSYRKKRMTRIEEYKKKFKKLRRVKDQRADWQLKEENGEIVKKWYKNEPKTPEKKIKKRKPNKKKTAKRKSSKKKTAKRKPSKKNSPKQKPSDKKTPKRKPSKKKTAKRKPSKKKISMRKS